MKIEAKVIADSINEFGNRLTTMVITFPRFILAEGKTHRIISGMLQETSIGLNDDPMLSKNSASSRAIPFNKMVESIRTNPFIPIAWQKEHKGMQGTEYITDEFQIKGEVDAWLSDRDDAIDSAILRGKRGLTKQIINRPLEPFMWHTVIVTATEWDNFFELRCPIYEVGLNTYRSRKDVIANEDKHNIPFLGDTLGWLQCNKGQAEIHMMALAEAMWDARNESTPERLKAGEWHIPYKKEIHDLFCTTDTAYSGQSLVPDVAWISSVMCARVSYTVAGHDLSEWTYSKYIDKAKELANAKPLHASPFEHCAEAMGRYNRETWLKGVTESRHSDYSDSYNRITEDMYGWCRNFRGFIQLRAKLEAML